MKGILSMYSSKKLKEYTPKPRTGQQNRALHLFYRILAETLNDAGLDQRKVLKPSVSIPWTPKAVKENLWRPIQKALLGKESTTELSKLEDIDKVHELLMKHLGEKFGVEYIPFPSEEVTEDFYKMGGYKIHKEAMMDDSYPLD